MSITDRLGRLYNSYRNDKKEPGQRSRTGARSEDADYEDAMDELDRFLKGEPAEDKPGKNEKRQKNDDSDSNKHGTQSVPKEIIEDLAVLGLPPDATENQCKETYKKLLKIHHPDRHAGHPGNMEKATKKSAVINASYDRLEKWFRLNK